MTEKPPANKISGDRQNLRDIWRWFEFQSALIREEQSRVFDSLGKGDLLELSRYVGKTLEELGQDFFYQTAELGWVTILGMHACTEAALRVDFIDRVKNKKKDATSRKFRDIAKKRGIDRIRLAEDILDIWKDHGSAVGLKSLIGEFKGVVHLRHWLAHGRFWKPKLGRASGYDPVEVFEICKALLQAIDLLPADEP